MRGRWKAVLTAFSLLAATLSTATTAAAQRAALPPPDAVQTRVAANEYRIGALDMINVEVFQIPDLTKELQVDQGGTILLPLIGSVQAAGRTPTELSSFIERELEREYVKDAQVTVTVKNSSSQRVTIDGAVIKPGMYPLTGPTTLLQAVALAEGPDTRLANTRKVAIFRTVGGQRQHALFDLNAIRQGKAADPQVYADDVIVVETSGARSLLRDIGGLTSVFNIFRPW